MKFVSAESIIRKEVLIKFPKVLYNRNEGIDSLLDIEREYNYGCQL